MRISESQENADSKCFKGKWNHPGHHFAVLLNLFLSVKVVFLATDAKFPNWVLTKAVIILGWDFGPILWLFICNSIINSALPRLKTDPWRQKVENVKICEILIKPRTNESLATNMQKANDDGPILQIYKLESRKKPSLYYTHDVFSSLDGTFCASTQNCPLWVTNSVRKKYVILAGLYLHYYKLTDSTKWGCISAF